MTVKIRKTPEVAEEINVDFPVYKRFGSGLYRIESENTYTGVIKHEFDGQFEHSLENTNEYSYALGLFLLEGTDITKEEFEKAYTEALSYLTRKIFIESTEPATDEEIREKIEMNCFSIERFEV